MLAAGMSSRFAPLSCEHPKGLLRVLIISSIIHTHCASVILLQYMRLERQMNIVLGMHFMEELQGMKKNCGEGSVRKQEKMVD